jgi:CheY-like chemotaxis protein
MTKILLVEDDKSLREIYGVRLLAEGYDVVSASDGEVALAMAIKERPALIITDVMMPKISGFDMLDILRSTTETRDIKVIVMTALGSEENKDRGERLGADRYLVKSQVGIEDVVNTVHELLGDGANTAQAAAPVPAVAPVPTRTAPPTPVPPRPTPPAPVIPPQSSVFTPPANTLPPANTPNSPGRNLVSSPAVAQPGSMPQGINTSLPPAAPPPQAPPLTSATGAVPPSRRTRVIQPISDPARKVNLQELVEKELAKEGSSADQLATADEERQVVNDQINNFVQNQPAATSAPTDTPADDATATPAPEPSQLPPVDSSAPAAPTTAALITPASNIVPTTPPTPPPVVPPASTPTRTQIPINPPTTPPATPPTPPSV